MFPSLPQDGDREWDEDVSREIARSSPRAASGVYGAVPDSPPEDKPVEDLEDEEHEIQIVPVRPQLSLAIAGFAALLCTALIVGAQTSSPDSRTPYGIVLFGVQLLFVLAWTMAMRPPVPALVAGVGVVAGGLATYMAVSTETARVTPLFLIALAGVLVIVGGQFAARVDRLRVRDALGSSVLIVFGVVATALLIVLTRRPVGTQAVVVCLAAAGFALIVARLIDAFFPKPRIAPQVPRGATGIIAGAMLGTLGAAALGSVLVLPFTPAKGAILGLVAAGIAVLVDLAINFTEAGRAWPGEAPTFWVARHMQGPLGAFAAVAPAAYLLTVFVLS
ncbi:hypothetical protein AB0M20_00840 [Actinoplanes sp. NPDC051633]|uniref:hypothetical protein n=1 Tax=Actinoplanes sp. NPDC051633 TaxID=3155670 RepID=UPI00343007B8